MVDTEARNKYAEILRHFAAGRMTNFEYDEARYSINTKDRAIHAKKPGDRHNTVYLDPKHVS